MNFKPFNIHHFHNGSVAKTLKFRGFTAVVSPGKDTRSVDVQMSFCSKKDIYCRKTGVSTAESRDKGEGYLFSCNARELLNQLDERAYTMKCATVDHTGVEIIDKVFLYKYLF